MEKWQAVFIVLVFYISLVIGISIKMKNKGIKGMYILLSFLFPFIIIGAIIMRLFDILIEKNRKLRDKFSEISATIYAGLACFPVLVGFSSARLARSLEESKKKKHRRKSPGSLIGNVFKSYDIFCDKYSKQIQEKFAH